MRKNGLRFLMSVLIVTVISLAGCGFHLQKNALPLGKKYPTMLLVPSGSNTLQQALRRAFIASGITVVEQAPQGTPLPTLRVLNEQITQQPLVYGPDSELRRQRLKMSVTFSFGTTASDQFTLATERDRQLNNKQHLGDNAEKIIIEQEMQNDIIHQLLNFLDRKPFS